MRQIAERLAANRRVNHELNPILFDEEDKLKPEVREKILQIVDEFLEYIQVAVKVLDIRLLGSNAAYNYTDDSDLDIHIITDLSKISDPETIARLYFDASKKNFKDAYDISIKGIEVEMYVEDVKASAISNGVYSVIEDKWIKEPTPLEEPGEAIITAAEEIEDQFIDAIEKAKDIEELEDLVDKLYLVRKDALAGEYGEMSPGNLAFKSLRSKGILDKVKDTIKDATSKELSLESKSINESTGEITSTDVSDIRRELDSAKSVTVHQSWSGGERVTTFEFDAKFPDGFGSHSVAAWYSDNWREDGQYMTTREFADYISNINSGRGGRGITYRITVQ